MSLYDFVFCVCMIFVCGMYVGVCLFVLLLCDCCMSVYGFEYVSYMCLYV